MLHEHRPPFYTFRHPCKNMSIYLIHEVDNDYYECFQLNENIRNAEINFFDKMIGLMHLLDDYFSTISEP